MNEGSMGSKDQKPSILKTHESRRPKGPISQGVQWLMRRPRAWWRNWWESRLPRRDHVTFTQRNLYILPTPAGWGFAAVLMVMLLASINEQINLGYALTFTLTGAALISMHLTHANVRGLSMRLLPPRSVHAGHVLRLGVVLTHPGTRRGRFGLRLKVSSLAEVGLTYEENTPFECEVSRGGEAIAELDVPAVHRGWLRLPRLTLESRYPLGLFRAWGYWRPQGRVLVWPALDPLAPPLPDGAGSTPDAKSARPLTQSAGEMPQGLRGYRRGDPMRLIAWKKSSHTLASGTGLVSREPAAGRTRDVWLDWDLSQGLEGLSPEARLSRLATWAIQADQQAESTGVAYGLRLPGQVLECGRGGVHLRACLDMLALWGQDAPDSGGASR
ncbi:MAG: DUF58 domain-containing protein [Burkholderiales bacterium]|nr:DUF58 domain-containing protein [Burkholderiales bacterium]